MSAVWSLDNAWALCRFFVLRVGASRHVRGPSTARRSSDGGRAGAGNEELPEHLHEILPPEAPRSKDVGVCGLG